MEIKVKEKYYCPFKSEETIEFSECTADTETRCSLQDGEICFPWYIEKRCPLMDNKIITVTWVG